MFTDTEVPNEYWGDGALLRWLVSNYLPRLRAACGKEIVAALIQAMKSSQIAELPAARLASCKLFTAIGRIDRRGAQVIMHDPRLATALGHIEMEGECFRKRGIRIGPISNFPIYIRPVSPA